MAASSKSTKRAGHVTDYHIWKAVRVKELSSRLEYYSADEQTAW